MPDSRLPIDQDTLAEMIEDMAQRLHLHSPEDGVKGAAMVACGVSLIVRQHGAEGLTRAAGAATGGIGAAIDSGSLDTPHDALAAIMMDALFDAMVSRQGKDGLATVTTAFDKLFVAYSGALKPNGMVQ